VINLPNNTPVPFYEPENFVVDFMHDECYQKQCICTLTHSCESHVAFYNPIENTWKCKSATQFAPYVESIFFNGCCCRRY